MYLISALAGLALGISAWSIVRFYALPKFKEQIVYQIDSEEDHAPVHDELVSFDYHLWPISFSCFFFPLLLCPTLAFPRFGSRERDPEHTDAQEYAEIRKTDRLFIIVQILTSAFTAFVHGSNDVR